MTSSDDKQTTRQHRVSTKQVYAIAIFLLTTIAMPTIMQQPATAASANLVVSSQDSSGNAINGYWTAVSQNGAMVQTGFTTASFTLAQGTYSVSVSDYGSYFFSHWSDGTTARDHPVTIGASAVSLTAVYSTSSGGGGGGGGSATLSVNSVDSNGNAITGYWTVVSQGSSSVKTGFTPLSTTLASGTYSVSVSDYGSFTFSHWSDGTTTRAHTVTISSSAVSLTAVYSGSSGGGGGGGGGHPGSDGTGTSPAGPSAITVYAARIPSSYWQPCFALTCSAGTGPGAQMYVALEDANGNVVAAGFTDENGHSFTGLDTSASYYLIYPDDCNYCHNTPHNVVFSHWQDGNTVRPRQAGTGEAYTAWYQYVPLQ